MATLIAVTSAKTFSIDRYIAMDADKSLYLAGVSLQAYLLFIVVRDFIISIGYFRRKDRDAFILIILTHYFASCLDMVLLGIILLWTTAALLSESTAAMLNDSLCPGGQ